VRGMTTATKKESPKVFIIEEVFLGEIKFEDFVQKEVALLVEKYK
jgi:hypothetical protein